MNLKEKMFFRFSKYIFPFLLSPLLFLIDFLVRVSVFAQFTFIESMVYFSSFVFLNEFLFTIISLKRKIQIGQIIYIHLFFAFPLFLIFLITIMSYSIFFYFGILPNEGMIDYFIKEPFSVWQLAINSIHYVEVVAIIFSLVLCGFITVRIPFFEGNIWKRKMRFALLPLSLLVLMLTANKYDQCRMPFSKIIADTLCEVINHSTNSQKPMQLKERVLPIPASKPVSFNLLLIINESVRRSSQSIYSESIATTPNLLAFKRRFCNNFFQFRWSHTNSTMTYLSVPTILNGISPTNSDLIWESAPLLWDYAKAVDLYTILVSGSCFKWGKWHDLLLRSRALDYYYTECQYTKELCANNGKYYSHKMGIPDDRIFIEKLIIKIDSLRKEHINFCAVLHLYGPHYPYWHLATNRLITKTTLYANYLNSIYQQDQALSILFYYLENCGLLKRTCIIHTSDHGEAFSEHGNFGHLLNYYEEDIGIPTWFFIPDTILNQLSENQKTTITRNLSRNISNIDLLPTVIELFDIERDSSFLKRFDGMSVFKEIKNNRIIYISNYNKMQFKTINQSYAIITDSLKYIISLKNNKLITSCFDFYNDQTETNDLLSKDKKMQLPPINWCLLLPSKIFSVLQE